MSTRPTTTTPHSASPSSSPSPKPASSPPQPQARPVWQSPVGRATAWRSRRVNRRAARTSAIGRRWYNDLCGLEAASIVPWVPVQDVGFDGESTAGLMTVSLME